MIEYENYHKHTADSNVYTPDSVATYQDYFDRTIEVGGKTISTVEHGWCGNNFDIYLQVEKFNKKLKNQNKEPLKFVFGGEFYWVKDRHEKDNSNCHMVILARNENGRKKINGIMSQCNKDGFYFKPRLDIELIKSLPKNDVMITTACIAGWKYDNADEIFIDLSKMFPHFFLEVQSHNTKEQKELNAKILEISKENNIPIIAGLDSHMINSKDSILREDFLKSKKIFYDDEEGWTMDYPTGDELYQRFVAQGILSEEEIMTAINNTLVIRDFENIIYDKSIKVPIVFPNKTLEERNEIFKQLINKQWMKAREEVPREQWDKYIEQIRYEVGEIIGCNMADYFLTTYETMKLGTEKYKGVLTRTGRGSGCSEYINKLLEFTNVDRISARVTMYPERFMTKERILESHTPPDIDHNVADREPYKKAQEELLGSAYDLIAFGTLKFKSAWKMYARAYDVEPSDADIVSKQIDKYEDKLKHAERDETTGELLEEVNIHDFVEEKYWNLLEGCKKYLGVKDSRKGHPCGTLATNLNVEEEVGVILCKSETTKKEVLVACIESGNIDYFGWLKQDFLLVDVVRTTNAIYERLGMKPHTIKELLELTDGDKATWDIYAKGLTLCINQVEQPGSRAKTMEYKPQNEVELCALIAGIRPSFASLIKTLLKREEFNYGIPSLDNLIQTPEMPYTFILYQEQLMQILGFAGFPMKETYDIVKSVSKKKTYCRECGVTGNSSMKICPHCGSTKISPLVDKFKEQFAKGFAEKLKDAENKEQVSSEVWHIVEAFAGYGFNASHSYCMALDSLNQAYLKAHYPLAFYETMLRRYTEKGNKDKVKALKEEMKNFNIKLGDLKFGEDNRNFTMDEETNTISQSLVAIKGVSQTVANEIYELSKEKDKYNNFMEIVHDIKTKRKGIKKNQLTLLIEVGYFSKYGSISYLEKCLELYDLWYNKKVYNKVNNKMDDIVRKFAGKETKKQLGDLDNMGLINYFLSKEFNFISTLEKALIEFRAFGDIEICDEEYSPTTCIAIDLDDKWKTRKITFYNICSGKTQEIKVGEGFYTLQPIKIGDVVDIFHTFEKPKKVSFEEEVTDKDGNTIMKKRWRNSETEVEFWCDEYHLLNEEEIEELNKEEYEYRKLNK